MIELFGTLARVYPVLLVVGGLALIGAVLGAWSRVSSGSVTAGPAAVPTPPTAGLEALPWAAQMIEDALTAHPDDVLERLERRGGDLGVQVAVPDHWSAYDRLDAVLDQLEASLQLRPHRIGPWADPEAPS